MPPRFIQSEVAYRNRALHAAFANYNEEIWPKRRRQVEAENLGDHRFLDGYDNEDDMRTFQYVAGREDEEWLVCTPEVPTNNNFWRALAMAHGGFQKRWPIYKWQVHKYLEWALSPAIPAGQAERPQNVSKAGRPEHPRRELYDHLDTRFNLPNQGLTEQARAHPYIPVTHPMWQVVADLYDIELIIITQPADISGHYPVSERNPYQIYARGQPHRQQVFLSYDPDSDRQYQVVMPRNTVGERLAYRLSHSTFWSSVYRYPSHGLNIDNVYRAIQRDHAPPPPFRPPPGPETATVSGINNFLTLQDPVRERWGYDNQGNLIP